MSGPRYAQIEPTNRCNQRCIMCPRNDRLDVPVGDMDFNTFKKILNQLPAIQNLQLNGLGEPLLNKELPEMIKYAKSRGISVSINSNCALIDESLAKKLVESGLDLLKISMDSADAEAYQSIRGTSLEQTIKGIEALVAAKKEKQSSYPQLWFNSIIMKNNYKNLDEILKLGNRVGVDLIRFKPLNIFWAQSDSGLAVEPKELKGAIRKAIEIGKNLKIKHNLEDLLKRLETDTYKRPQENIPCYSPWNEVYIQYYGGVRLCCEFYSGKYDVGNMLEEDFKQIWNGAKMRQIRKEFKKGNTYFPVCKTCNRFSRNLVIYNKIQRIKSP